jgi:hypothetical protein
MLLTSLEAELLVAVRDPSDSVHSQTYILPRSRVHTSYIVYSDNFIVCWLTIQASLLQNFP